MTASRDGVDERGGNRDRWVRPGCVAVHLREVSLPVAERVLFPACSPRTPADQPARTCKCPTSRGSRETVMTDSAPNVERQAKAEQGTQLSLFPEPENELPRWFAPRGVVPQSTPARQRAHASRGWHPIGKPLGPLHSSCDSCLFLGWSEKRPNRAVEFYCRQAPTRRGSFEAVRCRWRGCMAWKRR